MDFEKLQKQIKEQAHIFFLGLYVQLLRYCYIFCIELPHLLRKPVRWTRARILDYQIRKVEKDLRKMEQEAEAEYGKGKGRSKCNC